MSRPRSTKPGRTRRADDDARSDSSSGVRANRGPRRSAGKGRDTGPRRRSGGVKVPAAAAKMLRAGHPWVYRDAVRRSIDDLEPGSVVRVAEHDGQHIGFGIVETDGVIALRMLSLEPELEWGAAEVARRIESAAQFRARWIGEGLQTAHRLVHGDSDGLPGLAVDRLGEYLLVYKYAGSVDSYLPHVLEALEGQKARGVYLQDRVRPVTADEKRPPAGLVAGKAAPPEFEVEEDGLRFLVDVTAPVSPGLFLDLREGRRLLEQSVEGCSVLNLFSFTGAFGVRAVRGKAASVANVDAAARSHARCRQNLAASGLDAEACEPISGDVFKHLEKFRQRDRSFDVVVVDPPPFSSVKGAVFSAQRDWSALMEAICGVVAPGGRVLAVCNAAKLTDGEFLTALGEGAGAAGRRARLTEERGLPVDFPVVPAFAEGRYLKIKLLHVL